MERMGAFPQSGSAQLDDRGPANGEACYRIGQKDGSAERNLIGPSKGGESKRMEFRGGKKRLEGACGDP